MSFTRLLGVALLALLIVAAPAGAAVKPRFLGTGSDPGVAVDAAGTAHVGWFTENDTVEYCQVPRRARRCTLRRSFQLTDFGVGKVQVLVPRPGAVIIPVSVFVGRSIMFSSTDGGQTFAAVPFGSVFGMSQALYGPGDTLSVMSGVGPAEYGRFGLDGSGPAETIVEFGDAFESMDTDLTLHEAGLVAFLGSGQGMRSIFWNGVGDPNAQENWVEGPQMAGIRVTPSAVTGKSGTFVAYVSRRGGVPRWGIYLRRVRGNRYGRARRLTRDHPTEIELAQGPRGNLALIWDSFNNFWIRRSRNGRRWSATRRLVRGSEPSDYAAALGRRGGWIVWDGSAGNRGSNPIRLARIPRR
jgi:hypothetical protein